MAQTIKLKRSATQGATPTTSQLALGEVAINTYDGKMYIKKEVGGTESIVEIGTGSGGSGLASSFTLYEYTATASQTTFSGSDDNSNSLEYDTDTPPKVLVYLNGVLLDFTTDYTATSGTSVVLTTGAAAGDLVQVAAYKSTVSTTLDIDLTDNQKLLLGTDDDLQIYHDGSNSIITESGAGSLILRGTNTYIQDSSSVNMIQALSGGAVTLNYNSAPKLATTSTGIDVTGVITTDGMTTSADINFGDNDKAVFGAGSDLQIYHDGSHSYVKDAGTGILYVQGSGQVRVGGADGTTGVEVNEGGDVKLRYNNASKLATTSTGIDVTGTATVDALTSSGTIKAETTFGGFLTLKRNDTTLTNNADIGSINFEQTDSDDAGVPVNILASGDGTAGGGKLRFYTGTPTSRAQRQTIYSNGDIEFYEDTGTTAKFHWDAADERLGLGTSSPVSNLHVKTSVDNSVAQGLVIERSANSDRGYINYNGGGFQFRSTVGDPIVFGETDAEHMRILPDGNVGIGTTTPDEFSIGSTYKYLAVGGDKPGIINLVDSGTSGSYLQFGTAAGVRRASIHTDSGSSDLAFTLNSSNSGTSLTERFRIKASNGYVGIGTTSPSQKLSVNGNIYSIGGFVNASGYQLNGTYIVDSSRNLVNIGTISSGAITSTGNITTSGVLQVNVGTASHQRFRITRPSSTTAALYMGVDSSNNAMIAANNSALRIGKDVAGTFYEYLTVESGGNTNVKNALEINNTTVIDSSRNLTNIGTISSGAITSSGNISGAALIIDSATAVDKTSHYMILYDGSGAPALYAGNTSDNRNYYQSNHHRFRSDDANTNFAEISSVGMIIGDNGPETNMGKLHVKDSDSGATPYQNGNGGITIERNGRAALNFLTPNTQDAYVFFGDPESANAGYVGYEHSTDVLVIKSGGYVKTTGSGLNVNTGNLQMGGTEVIDSSRNIAAGTITSGNITTTGYLAGPATFTIDPAAVGDNTGTVVIAGNLQVDGTTTTINSTTLTVDDKNITLASGSANGAAANGAGITVDCGSGIDATFTYDGTNDEWDLNKRTKITSSTTSALLELSGSATGVFQTIDNTNSSGLYSYLRLQASGRAEGSGYIIKNSGTGNGLSLGSLYLWNDGGTNDIIEFVPNATIANRTSIMENGNLIIRGDVGIGTDSPGRKLTVQGTSDAYIKTDATSHTSWTIGSDTYGFLVYDDDVGGIDGYRIVVSQTSGNVGIGTTSPQAKFQVEEAGIETTTTSTSATTQVAIDTFAAATFRSARYTIQVTNSTDSTYHITEILLIHDGTTPQITEYGTIFTGSAEATFDADISSGNVRLLATPATTDSMTFKVVRHCITV